MKGKEPNIYPEIMKMDSESSDDESSIDAFAAPSMKKEHKKDEIRNDDVKFLKLICIFLLITVFVLLFK